MARTRLSDAEWRVMNVVWRHERVTARRVVDELPRGTDWAYTTVKTMMDRLAQKGVLAANREGVQTEYEPLLSRRQAQIAAARGLVQKAFDGATSPLVHFLLEEEKLSDAERAELVRRLQNPSERKPAKGKKGASR